MPFCFVAYQYRPGSSFQVWRQIQTLEESGGPAAILTEICLQWQLYCNGCNDGHFHYRHGYASLHSDEFALYISPDHDQFTLLANETDQRGCRIGAISPG